MTSKGDNLHAYFAGFKLFGELNCYFLAGTSITFRIEPKTLDEIKTFLRKEIMSDLTKIVAENQRETPKLIAPSNKKQPVYLNYQDSDSEPENISVARTSTLVKTTNATNSKTKHRPIVVTSSVSPGMVSNAEKQEKLFWFSSLDQFGAIIICRIIRNFLVSLCGLKQKKSHYNSRVSLHEAPTKKTICQ